METMVLVIVVEPESAVPVVGELLIKGAVLALGGRVIKVQLLCDGDSGTGVLRGTFVATERDLGSIEESLGRLKVIVVMMGRRMGRNNRHDF